MAGSQVVGTLRAVLSAQIAEFETAMTTSAKLVEGFEQKLTGTKSAFAELEPRLTKITSLARDFSGVLEKRTAEEYAQAVHMIGGADQLVEQDQIRVNRAMQEALAHYRALGKEAPDHIVKLEAATRQASQASTGFAAVQQHLSTEAGNFATRVRDMALGVFTGEAAFQALNTAGRAAVTFLKDSIGEAVEADKAQRQLTAALRQQGIAVPIVIEQYDELAEKYAKTTVQTDDALRATEALLTTVGGVMPAQMDAALNAVTNLASGLGIDLNSATMMVAKSFEDNFGALKKAGVVIDETRAKTEGMTYVLGQVQAKFGGQAQAEVESYSGQLAQLNKQWKELQETVGKKILESGILGKLNAAFIVGTGVITAYWNAVMMPDLPRMTAGLHDFKDGVRVVNQAFAEGTDDINALIGSYASAAAMSERLKQAQLDAAAAAKKIADKEEQDRLKRYREEIERLRDQLSGVALQGDVRKLTEAFHGLSLEQRTSETVLKRVGDQAYELSQRGAHLTPELATIVLRLHNIGTEAPRADDALGKLAASTAISIDLWRRQKEEWAAAAVGLGQLAEKFKAFDPSKLGTSILSDFLGFHKDETKRQAEAAEAAERKLNLQFQQSVELLDLIGRSGGGAFATLMHGASGAVGAINQIRTSTTALGTALGALNLGANLLGTASALMNTGWQRRRQELIDEISRLGATPEIPAFGSMKNSATDVNRLLERQVELLREQRAETDRLTEAERQREEAARAIQREADDVARVTRLVEEYGLSFDALGNSIQQAFVNDAARTFADDFEFLISRGADLQTVIDGMSDEAQDFLNRALQFGLEIPASMRPLFQALIDTGKLVDENGNKIEDLSQLNFAETLTEGFDRVEAAVLRVAEVLERSFSGSFASVGAQASELAEGIQRKLGGIRFDIRGSIAEAPEVSFGKAPGFANGTNGLRNFGDETVVRLHGWESVETAEQVRARMQAGTQSMANIERLLQRLGPELAITVRSAMQLA